MEKKYTNPLYSIEQMEGELLEIMSTNQLTEARKAYRYAKKAHDGQTRKEGLPYIIHPMTLAYSALKQGIIDDDIIAVMFLHDICEDCGISSTELPFSKIIQDAVWSLTFTREDGETKAEAKKKYYEKVRQNRLGVVVKIFDRCHNISAMGNVYSYEKMERYIAETKEYVLPLIEISMREYPEYSSVIFGMQYHMKSVLYMAQSMLDRNMHD